MEHDRYHAQAQSVIILGVSPLPKYTGNAAEPIYEARKTSLDTVNASNNFEKARKELVRETSEK